LRSATSSHHARSPTPNYYDVIHLCIRTRFWQKENPARCTAYPFNPCVAPCLSAVSFK
jgi:hypothetical protein